MSTTYKKAFIYGEGDVRIEEVQYEPPGDNDVLIRVKEASVCPSDLRIYRGFLPPPPAGKPQAPGHEYAGVVAEVGKNVTRIKEGMRVVVQSWTPCFMCENCRKSWYSRCMNMHTNMGGFAEYASVNETSVLEIPSNTSFGNASVTEPLASIYRAVQETCEVTAGKKVVVMGLGPMGCMHVAVSHLLGADVLGIDLMENRCEIAAKMGADEVVNASKTDAIEAARQWCNYIPGRNGRGADVVIVTVGGRAQVSALEQAFQFIGVRAIINSYAGATPVDAKMEVEPNLLHYREVRFTGTSSYSPKHFMGALDLISSHKVDVSKIRTPILPLEEIKKAFDISGTSSAMKVGLVISP